MTAPSWTARRTQAVRSALVAVYLVYADADIDTDAEGPWDEIVLLRPGLAFVRSDLHRSAVYHAMKDALPARTALLLSELEEAPKFKGMEPGTLAWIRRNLG